MRAQFSIALVFVLCGLEKEAVATDCISRREFEDFKANVLNHIQELTLQNDKQAKQIEYQKKAILDLRKLLAKSGEISVNLNQNDTAVTSNQSLPREPSILFSKDLISKPHGKRVALRMYFYFYIFWLMTKKVQILNNCFLQKKTRRKFHNL